MRRKNTPGARNLAKERLKELFIQASEIYTENEQAAHKHVGVARRLAMRFNLRIPKEFKRAFCKHCYHYLKQGKNVRVRRTEKGIVYTCLDSNKHMRYTIKITSKD